MKKTKYYVVWKGHKPGIYDNWEAAKAQVDVFTGAQYKSFPSLAEAKIAFSSAATAFINYDKAKKIPDLNLQKLAIVGKPILNSICVDAACSGNPGVMEYKGVEFATGKEFFKQGPYQQGTNNIGEFLAIVRALAMLKHYNNDAIIYSDSKIAISWVKEKKCKTKLMLNAKNEDVFKAMTSAENWLATNTYTTIIKKWETEAWGENPADFGRK
jgi:ribonuclease HI